MVVCSPGRKYSRCSERVQEKLRKLRKLRELRRLRQLSRQQHVNDGNLRGLSGKLNVKKKRQLIESALPNVKRQNVSRMMICDVREQRCTGK
jgi:hypothetical protein